MKGLFKLLSQPKRKIDRRDSCNVSYKHLTGKFHLSISLPCPVTRIIVLRAALVKREIYTADLTLYLIKYKMYRENPVVEFRQKWEITFNIDSRNVRPRFPYISKNRRK